ncbi:MAG: hypothetical protein IPJ71_12500 [Bdellovibrionales bacterium]|nr:hypothetical protein [Bdellovibrionales bacterium]
MKNNDINKNRDRELEARVLQKLKGLNLQLHSHTLLEDAPDDELWGLIRRLYEDGESTSKIMATVLNYAATSGQSVFTLSMSILTALIRDDENLELKKPSDATLRKFFAMAKGSVLKELFPYQEAGEGCRARAGLYLINDEDIRSLLADETLDKEESIIELYAKSNKIEPEEVSNDCEVTEEE